MITDSKHNYPNLCPCDTYDPEYPDSNLKCVNNPGKHPLPPIANLTNDKYVGRYFSAPQICVDNKTLKKQVYQRPVVVMFTIGDGLDPAKLYEILEGRYDDIVINTTSLVGLSMKRDDDLGLGIFNKKYEVQFQKLFRYTTNIKLEYEVITVIPE